MYIHFDSICSGKLFLFAWIFLSVLLRRQGIFLFAPLIYTTGMLLYFGTFSFDVVPIIKHRPAPGSLYHSPQLYAKLRYEMDADNSSADAAEITNPYDSFTVKPHLHPTYDLKGIIKLTLTEDETSEEESEDETSEEETEDETFEDETEDETFEEETEDETSEEESEDETSEEESEDETSEEESEDEIFKIYEHLPVG